MQDWLGSAGFDRGEDHWPRRWAEAYVGFAAGEKRSWLRAMGHRFFPILGWAERGGGSALGHGNSVPRFHLTWGTGPGVIEPFVWRAREAERAGRLQFCFRHRVDEIDTTNGAVDGASGAVLEPSDIARGEASSRNIVGTFAFKAQAVILASGGIGGNADLVRANWPARLGAPPQRMVCGVPAHVDGRGLAIAEARRRAAHQSRPHVALCRRRPELERRSGPTTASASCRAPPRFGSTPKGRRLPAPLFPGYDTLARSNISCAAAMITPGSSRTRASCARNSRSRARSRIPTSPARTGASSPAAREASRRPRRSRRSRAMAWISS